MISRLASGLERWQESHESWELRLQMSGSGRSGYQGERTLVQTQAHKKTRRNRKRTTPRHMACVWRASAATGLPAPTLS
jgi:hypothetical protein